MFCIISVLCFPFDVLVVEGNPKRQVAYKWQHATYVYCFARSPQGRLDLYYACLGYGIAIFTLLTLQRHAWLLPSLWFAHYCMCE